MNYIIEDTEYNIMIQSTKKQQLQLEITSEGLITLLVPKKTTEEEISRFLNKNAGKIKKAKQKIENRVYLSSVKTYEQEEHFMVFGKLQTLGELLGDVVIEKEEIQQFLFRYYTQKTREIVEKQIAYYEPIIGVKAKQIKVVDSPKTWGTCDSSRNLTFNYRLSMAAPAAIDYVVIHELCHILHMNHDRSFWRKVGMYDKNYKEHQEYLARFGFFMTI